jgi:surface antigen
MTTPTDVVARAERELGYEEVGTNRTKYGAWFGLNGAPWCAMFVSWVFYHEGLPLPFEQPKGFALTDNGVIGFKRWGRWHTTAPQRGVVVFFDRRSSNAGVDHAGIVTAVRSDGRIQTIEGNATNRVERCQYTRSDHRIVGYGRPRYDEEEDMPSIGEIQKVVNDMYRLLARGEIKGKRSEAHYLTSIAGLKDHVKTVEENMYRLLARGEINGKRSEGHYLYSTASLRDQLLAQQSQITALQEEIKHLTLKVEATAPLPAEASGGER